jgi:hypothetical protein
MSSIRTRRSAWTSRIVAAAVLVLVIAIGAGVTSKTANVALAAPETAQVNEVTNWNIIAQTTVLAQPPNTSAPPASAVFMAMVQGAVYGAVNAIDRRHRQYLVLGRVDPLASKQAAVATAAFHVLDTLFPAQHATLQAQYDSSLNLIPDGDPKQAGIDVGNAAADAMLAEGHDGRLGPIPPLPPDGPGYWEPLVVGGIPQLDPSPWVARAQPFLVESSSQFRTAGPNALTSAAYTQDFNEVKAIGGLDSLTRTPEQTHISIFWQSNPAANLNGVARRFAEDPSLALDVTDSALLFAMMDLTAADAQINCWNDKYYWGFWRPIAAIREADTDGNPATEPDPDWTPRFTPPYPDHPSGALCFNSSSLHALQAFFGTDEMTFYVTSSQFPGEQRTFHRFSDVISELIEARIWGGLHFRTADVQGARLGEEVSRYTQLHWFEPLR